MTKKERNSEVNACFKFVLWDTKKGRNLCPVTQINVVKVSRHWLGRAGLARKLSPSDRNVNKTKVNVVQRGEINTRSTLAAPMEDDLTEGGSLNGVQSLPPGSELKMRNVRCQQKSTRWFKRVDAPSKKKKKRKKTCPTAFRNLIRQFSSPLIRQTVTSPLLLNRSEKFTGDLLTFVMTLVDVPTWWNWNHCLNERCSGSIEKQARADVWACQLPINHGQELAVPFDLRWDSEVFCSGFKGRSDTTTRALRSQVTVGCSSTSPVGNRQHAVGNARFLYNRGWPMTQFDRLIGAEWKLYY